MPERCLAMRHVEILLDTDDDGVFLNIVTTKNYNVGFLLRSKNPPQGIQQSSAHADASDQSPSSKARR